MKADELKTKTPDELKQVLTDLKKEAFNLRFRLSQGQLENKSTVRTTRRNIARVMTVLKGDNKVSTKEVTEKPVVKKVKKIDKAAVSGKKQEKE